MKEQTSREAGKAANTVADGGEADRLFELSSAFRVSQVLYVAAKLDIADLLADRTCTAASLARACGADATALGWVIEVLRDEGLLKEDVDRYSLTPLGTALRREHPGRARAWILHLAEEVYGAWGACLHTVLTGEAAFEHVYGTGWWAHLDNHPSQAAHLAEAMSATVLPLPELLDAHCDLAAARHVVDVGGGDGSTCVALLRAHPGLRATVLDTPQMAVRARERLAAAGVDDRGDAVGGDFRTFVPGGADLYLLCRVLSDWDDADALTILSSSRAALRPDARLAVVAGLGGDDKARPALVNLHLRVLMGGRERTLPDYRTLLSLAGLDIVREVDTGQDGLFLFEARARTDDGASVARSRSDHREPTSKLE